MKFEEVKWTDFVFTVNILVIRKINNQTWQNKISK